VQPLLTVQPYQLRAPAVAFIFGAAGARASTIKGVCSSTARCGRLRYLALIRLPEMKGRICVSTVNIVCATKTPVPVRAEGVFDPPHLHCR
jgi:hypothetical protein